MRICDILIECLHSKRQTRVCIFPHCDFQRLILWTIKKYSLLVELIRIDRNSEEINLAKLNSRIVVEVLTLPVAAEPTLRATVNVQFSSHYTTWLPWRTILFCKHVDFYGHSVRFTCRDVSLHTFPQVTHGKHIGNRKQTFWKNKVHWVIQTIIVNNLNFLFEK